MGAGARHWREGSSGRQNAQRLDDVQGGGRTWRAIHRLYGNSFSILRDGQGRQVYGIAKSVQSRSGQRISPFPRTFFSAAFRAAAKIFARGVLYSSRIGGSWRKSDGERRAAMCRWGSELSKDIRGLEYRLNYQGIALLESNCGVRASNRCTSYRQQVRLAQGVFGSRYFVKT